MSFPSTTIAGIIVPDTPLVKEAINHAKSELPPWLFHHVMRSWLFAVKLAKAENAVVDQETLAVESILHDMGLAPAYTTPDRRFEVDGAAAAVAFLDANQGNSPAPDTIEYHKHNLRKVLVWHAVALHTTPSLAGHSSPEVALSHRGTSIDFGGYGLERLPDPMKTVEVILEAYPRLAMKDELRECLCSIVRTKPATTHDNFTAAFGEAYVDGYERSTAGPKMLVAGLQENPLEK